MRTALATVLASLLMTGVVQAQDPVQDYRERLVAETAKRALFVLNCEDAQGYGLRVALFRSGLGSFPKMRITHNEAELERDNVYSYDRLEVSTVWQPIGKQPPELQALVVFDSEVRGEIYPAGLTFYIEMTAEDERYFGEFGRQLRDAVELPTALWPTPLGEFETPFYSIERLIIDRVTAQTTVRVTNATWPHDCAKDDDVLGAATIILNESLTALDTEKERITKMGPEKQL